MAESDLDTPASSQDETFLTDTYIPTTFGPELGQNYLERGLKLECLRPIWDAGSAFVVASHFREGFRRDEQALYVVDKIVRRGGAFGTVVPQRRYDSGPSVGAELEMPLFFVQTDGTLGVPLKDAVESHCSILQDALVKAPLGGKTSKYIRINWPGYQDFKRQIQTRDETARELPITMEKCLGHVGRAVEHFLQNGKPDGDGVGHWKVTANPQLPISEFADMFGRNKPISRDDIIIIGLIHTSAGSFMPILQLSRFVDTLDISLLSPCTYDIGSC